MGALSGVGSIVLLFPLLIILFVAAATRGDFDQTGKRSYATYLGAGQLLGLVLLLMGVFVITSGLLHFTIKSDFGNLVTDAAWREVVNGLILVIVGGATCWYHKILIHNLRTNVDYSGSAAERVINSFALFNCFLGLAIKVLGAVMMLNAVFRLIAPGVFLADNRGAATREFVKAFVIAIEGGLVWLAFRRHTILGGNSIWPKKIVPSEPQQPSV